MRVGKARVENRHGRATRLTRRVIAVGAIVAMAGACTVTESDDAPTSGGPTGTTDGEPVDSDESGGTGPTEAEVLMPNVVGMGEDAAIEKLDSLGAARPTIDEEPSLDDAGTVVDQNPSPGEDMLGTITLTVGAPLPPMPDYVGKRVGDVRAELEKWGVTVVEEQELSLERAEGEVVGTVPTADEVISSEVRLMVAAAPVIGHLGTHAVPEVESDVRTNYEPVNISGELYEQGIYVYSSDYDDPGEVAGWMAFDLGRDWETFEVTVGIRDDSTSSQAGRFRIKLDDATIWEKDLEFGESEDVSINVSGGLRLRLEIVPLKEGSTYWAWGDPRVLGVPGKVPELPAGE